MISTIIICLAVTTWVGMVCHTVRTAIDTWATLRYRQMIGTNPLEQQQPRDRFHR